MKKPAEQTKLQKEQFENIDYMHPDGIPIVSEEQRRIDESQRKQLRPRTKSIDEADGHHMCSEQCRAKHRQ